MVCEVGDPFTKHETKNMSTDTQTLNIRPVSRDSAKLVIGLAGTSGSGKTYSALQLAYGLAGKDASKVGLLDTENRRGSLYSHLFDKPFLIGDLTAPFSPERYRKALAEFSATGIEVVVVDSMSHEWEGEGGCDEIAQASLLKGKKMADWITAKREHHRFMRFLLAMPCHVIPCFRAREKASFKTNPPTSIGIQPICEKNVMFECTVSFMLDDEGRHREAMKSVPEYFSFLKDGQYLSREHGLKMREWCGGLDPIERSRNILRLAAGQGLAQLGSEWVKLDKPTQKALASFKDTLKDLAQHADDERVAVKGDNGAPDGTDPTDYSKGPELL